jgi:GNAT superfamily N-acetyltransferase
MSDDERCVITWRPARVTDCLAAAEVNLRAWRESFPERPLHSDDRSVERRAAIFSRRFAAAFYRMHVAEACGRVVGFVDVGQPREAHWNCEAELYAIYVLKAYQRRGVGRRLFELACEAAVAAGRTSMYLIALQDSPYRPFYEGLGARQLASRAAGAVPGQDAHVIYGWLNLQPPASRRTP